MIVSSPNDLSTNDVLDWIYYLKDDPNIVRVNDYELPDTRTIILSNEKSQKSEKIWYRRGKLHKNYEKNNQSNPIVQVINNSFQTEADFIESAYMNFMFDSSKSINAIEDNNTNKILNLKIAQSIDLTIPKSIISNNTEHIIAFVEDKNKYIIKDVAFDTIKLESETDFIMIDIVPKLITGQELIRSMKRLKGKIDNTYLFVQEYVDKRFEIRIFYLQEKFYSMAIFSQNNPKTKIDFRNYDQQTPNRCIPYQLPGKIESKLKKIMRKININCGSIDLIYTPTGDYVFLEVNPIGQFQWLSHNCNYDIEKEIAKFLINE